MRISSDGYILQCGGNRGGVLMKDRGELGTDTLVQIPCHISNLKPSSIYCIYRKKKAKKANQEKLILINKNKYTFCGKIEL